MTTAIAIGKLDLSPLNVRKTPSTKEADAELLASIRHHDVLENLVVVPSKKKGRFEVIAGGRRLKTLQILVETGEKKSTDTVHCLIKEAEEAAELSLIENTHRAPMHPVDEFEAYNTLIESGTHDEKAVAERFGVKVRHVQQRMKLAKIHPEILAAYKAGKLTYDAVTGFTVTDNQQEQLEAWNTISTHARRHHHREIERHTIIDQLTENTLKPDSALAKYVGLKSYKAAGGAVISDLFSEASLLCDAELAMKLAVEKLSKLADKIKAEGWGWVEVSVKRDWNFVGRCTKITSQEPEHLATQYAELEKEKDELEEKQYSDNEELTAAEEKRIDELEKLLEELEEKIEAESAFNPEEMLLAGCCLSLEYNGKPLLERGLVRREDARALRALQAGNDPENNDLDSSTEADTVNDTDDHFEPSKKLAAELTAQRLEIVRAHLANAPETAMNLLLFSICINTLFASYHSTAITTHRNIPTSTNRNEPFPDSPTTQLLNKAQDALELGWHVQTSTKQSYINFCNLPAEEKAKLSAWCAAKNLEITLSTHEFKNSDAEIAVEEMDIQWSDYWRPTTENFLGKIKKDDLLDIGERQFSTEWRAQHENDKQPVLAALLEDQLSPVGWIPPGFAAQP